jgi:hypothetical protein
MKVRTIDGKLFEAEEAEDLVRQLWQDARVPSLTMFTYMVESAARAGYFTDIPIRVDRPVDYVADMVLAGFLRVVDKEGEDL